MPEFLSPQPGDQAEVLEEARAGTAVYHAGMQGVLETCSADKV